MSFLSRLFGTRPEGRDPTDVEKRLQELEAEAESAIAGYVGTSYNQAGDLALRSGQLERAVEYYGRAIDAFLEDMQREAARGVANKIIRVRPRAVRTLCTLTWLDLAAQHTATALLHLRDYVKSAKEVDQYEVAATQIYEMARIAPESEVIGAVADALDSLDFAHQAEEVRAWVKEAGSPDAIHDPDALAEACLRAAVHSNRRDEEMVRDADGEESAEADGPDGAGDNDVDAESGDQDEPASDDPPAVNGEGADSATSKRYRWD
jgi:tetratricopeptide (TPR) repeat protein